MRYIHASSAYNLINVVLGVGVAVAICVGASISSSVINVGSRLVIGMHLYEKIVSLSGMSS